MPAPVEMQGAPPDALPAPPDALQQPQYSVDPDQPEQRELATKLARSYRRHRDAKRARDLTAEKYLLHIDGDGDAQWMDIHQSGRIGLPGKIGGGLRLQQNLERPLVDQWVSFHTSQTYQVVAKPKPDREARDRARVDTLLVNDLFQRQRVNQVFREALYLAGPYGSCPVFAMWRADTTQDVTKPVYNIEGGPTSRPGYVDIFAGDPWSMIYAPGSNVSTTPWAMYQRTLPLEVVREAFKHVKGIEALKGSSMLPSTSRFQRISNKWSFIDSGVHGAATIRPIEREQEDDKQVALICREVAPGIDPRWPQGRLTILALSGVADADPELRDKHGEPMFLHDGRLPASRFSFVRLFAGFRADDEYGKPYVADIDDLQVELNQLITHRTETIRRMARPPFVTLAGALPIDTDVTQDDVVIELHEGTNFKHGFLYPPEGHLSIYDSAIEDVKQQMFRLGGWQAASRGESNAGDPAAKVAALQKADDTVFGPVQQQLREALCDLAVTAHALVREYANDRWMVEHATGDDLAYLARPWIEPQELSGSEPTFVVVSGYGATPEARTQELLSLLQVRDAYGTPLLTTEDFWRLNPDQSLRPPEISADHLRKARAHRTNYALQEFVAEVRKVVGDQAGLAIEQIHTLFSIRFPVRRSDPPKLHLEVLDQLVQDEDEDVVVRNCAELRQDLYWDVIRQQQAAQAAQAESLEAGEEESGRESPQRGRQRVAARTGEGGQQTSGPRSREMAQKRVAARTGEGGQQTSGPRSREMAQNMSRVSGLTAAAARGNP